MTEDARSGDAADEGQKRQESEEEQKRSVARGAVTEDLWPRFSWVPY